MQARGTQIERWYSAPLEPGLVVHGSVVDPEKVAGKLREAIGLSGISGKRITVALNEPGSLYRLVTLPKLPDTILPEAVKREAERVIPVSLDEVYLTYQVISSQEQDMTVFMAAFSKVTADNLLKTVQLSGLKPGVLELMPLALCRVIPRSSAVMASLRTNNFDIAIVVDRIPHVIRSLSLPGENESLADKLPSVNEELERTISFYNTGHADKPLDADIPVYVSGDLTQVTSGWLSEGRVVESLIPLIPGQTSFPDGFDSNEFIVNLGLALKNLSKTPDGDELKVDFNALPARFLPEKAKLSRVVVPLGAVLGIGVMGLLGLSWNNASNEVDNLNRQISEVQSSITQVNKDMASIRNQIKERETQIPPLQEQITQADTSVKNITSIINGWSSSRSNLDSALQQIVSVAPPSVTLTTITYGQRVGVSGLAPNQYDIYQYARDLRMSYPQLVVSKITLDNEGQYQFDIALSAK